MVDFNKYRKMSSFFDSNGNIKTKRQLTKEQAIMEFDIYQQYMPNTHEIYVNDSVIPILGTMTDVTDLETRSDSKWLLTSLKNKVYAGDVIRWENNVCLCIYDKIKNAGTCHKVKIQPCNTIIYLPRFDKNDNKSPLLLEYPVITGIYITDLSERELMPLDIDLLGMTITYDDYTKKLEKNDRIFLYNKAMEIVGIDYTNINFANKTNKGYLRLMLKVSTLNENDEKGKSACDYYSYFPKVGNVIIPPAPIGYSLQLNGNNTLTVYNSATFNADIYNNGIKDTTKTVYWKITDLNNIPSTLVEITNQNGYSLTIKSKSNIGQIKIKAICNQNASITAEKTVTIKNLV